MSNQRETRAAMAQETLQIIDDGVYYYKRKKVDISRDIEESNERTNFIPQAEADKLEREFTENINSNLKIELANETTLSAILRLHTHA